MRIHPVELDMLLRLVHVILSRLCSLCFAHLAKSSISLQIASQPGSQHFRCLFRVAFVPHDAYDMLRKDTTAFEYFYTQVRM